ncbi:hypothetical protein VTK26DRAFT_3646 [Humicola hyalothermophila]
MISSSSLISILLGAISFSCLAVAECTLYITAGQGDTCATLAAAVGITVSDFLRSNPSVKSCSQLVVGANYCVVGVADGPAVSADGTCGQGVTCSGSRFGTCCSAHGFCGSTSDYCGDGCQPEFGACGAGAGPSSPGASVTVTVTATSTVTTTTTAGATATTTRTVVTTRTSTVPVTVTSTARTTSTVRLTSISFSTRTVTATSLTTGTITSVVTSTRVVQSGACSTVRPPTVTAPPGLPGNPLLPGTPTNCLHYASIRAGDSCRDLADRAELTLLAFYQLNPFINCDALWVGYYVCVGR